MNKLCDEKSAVSLEEVFFGAACALLCFAHHHLTAPKVLMPTCVKQEMSATTATLKFDCVKSWQEEKFHCNERSLQPRPPSEQTNGKMVRMFMYVLWL